MVLFLHTSILERQFDLLWVLLTSLMMMMKRNEQYRQSRVVRVARTRKPRALEHMHPLKKTTNITIKPNLNC